MKFVLPKTIKILGHKIKVKLIDTHEYAGLWDYDLNTIFISINQSEKQIEETFHHEVRHSIQYHTGMTQAMSRDLMEIDAEMSSRIICDVIRKCYKK